jgi:hypothetical protein
MEFVTYKRIRNPVLKIIETVALRKLQKNWQTGSNH